MKLNINTKIMNWNLGLSFLTLITFTVISSCRKTVECPKASGKINYIGYDSTEVDSIKIYFYTKNTNFTTLIDSTLQTKTENYFEYFGDTCSLHFWPVDNRNLTSSDNSKNEIFDLKIVNVFDNKTVELKDFIYTINFKKSGGFDPGTNHCQSPIKSFVQNGILISGNDNVYITK